MSAGRTLVAVLGASNVTLGLPQLVASVRAFAGGPFDLLVAGGHGRSYGLATRVLGRGQPPIRSCGVFDDLDRLARTAGRTHVAITDIGNDLGYGVAPDRILSWIEECLGARPPSASSSLGLPPVSSLRRRSDPALRLFRLVLFPSARRLPLALLRARMDALDRGLRGLARDVDRVVEPDPAWYGWDPIHVRRRARSAAWSAHLQCSLAAVRMRAKDQLVRFARPSSWRLLGLDLGAAQPLALSDECRLWLR